MNKLLSVLLLLSFSTTALSLGEVNCSDAHGKLRRVEKEIWGANQISWYYEDAELSPDGPFSIEADFDNRVQVFGTEDNGHYIMDVNVHFKDGSPSVNLKVLCEAWRNGAID